MTSTPALLTSTFADHWLPFLRDLGLVDRSVEIGLYDRCAFAGTPRQWDLVYVAMRELRETLSGRERGSVTCAMCRIHVSEHFKATGEPAPVDAPAPPHFKPIAPAPVERPDFSACSFAALVDYCDAYVAQQAVTPWHERDTYTVITTNAAICSESSEGEDADGNPVAASRYERIEGGASVQLPREFYFPNMSDNDALLIRNRIISHYVNAEDDMNLNDPKTRKIERTGAEESARRSELLADGAVYYNSGTYAMFRLVRRSVWYFRAGPRLGDESRVVYEEVAGMLSYDEANRMLSSHTLARAGRWLDPERPGLVSFQIARTGLPLDVHVPTARDGWRLSRSGRVETKCSECGAWGDERSECCSDDPTLFAF